MGGEIDTKSIEPVRNAVSLFGDKTEQKKYQHTRNKRECEKELEELTKELANYKVQLDAKNAAHKQALLKLEQNQKMIHELSTLLKNSDIERNKHMNERSEGKASKDELESMMKEMADQNNETAKIRDQLSHVLTELKATQRELLNKETELVAARDSELIALANSKELENELKIEKEEKEKLMQQAKELHEVIHKSKLALIEADEKDEEIELDIEMEQKERKIMEQSSYIETLQLELNRFKQELKGAKEEIKSLNATIESLTSELQNAKSEMNKNKEKNIESEVDIALLKSQLQEQRLAYKNIEVEETNSDKNSTNNDNVTISMQEYKHLVGEAKKENYGKQSEIAMMKKEMENATVKIAELRARAEQALSRAEIAENAKAALEEKIRRHKEHRQRRRAALTALREESTPKPFSPASTSHGTPRMYQPLGKVLNMKL